MGGSSPSPGTPTGAYGLRVSGLDADPLAVGLQPVPTTGDWPHLQLSWEQAQGTRPPEHHVDDERGVILLIEGGHVRIERASGHAVIATREPVTAHDLVHPYLASPAALFAQWHGFTAIHAGAVLVNGTGWGVLGNREAGKTTLLLALHQAGHTVLSDDLTVLRDGQVFAGPRTLDLRPATADAAAASEPRIVVRDGERSRVTLPPAPWSVAFGGWVVLEEAEAVRVEPVASRDRLDVLAPQLMMGQMHHHDILDTMALPMWRLSRPKRWEALAGAAQLLVDTVTAGS